MSEPLSVTPDDIVVVISIVAVLCRTSTALRQTLSSRMLAVVDAANAGGEWAVEIVQEDSHE